MAALLGPSWGRMMDVWAWPPPPVPGGVRRAVTPLSS